MVQSSASADEQGHFLRSNDLSSLAEASVDGAGVLDAAPAILAALRGRGYGEGARLFAQPVVAAGPDGTGRRVSWYTEADGMALRWADLDGAAREQAARGLDAALATLAPAFRDPALGPHLQRWLNVPDLRHDLLVVGGQPVLTSWGLLPAEVAADAARRHAHFASGLGSILGRGEPPPFSDADVAPAELPAPGASSSEGAPARPVPAEPVVATIGASSRPVPPVRPPPRPWLVPAIACGAAALVLLLLVLLLPRFGTAVAAAGAGAPSAGETIALLEDRAAVLRRDLGGDLCRLAPSAPRADAPAEVRR